MLIVSNPIIVQEIKTRVGVVGYKLEPWLKTTKDDMFIINLQDILTLSESSDIEMIQMYQSFVRQSSKGSEAKLSRQMGYISSVNDAKDILEKLYNKDS